MNGKKYTYPVGKQYRWETYCSWAAPKNKDGYIDYEAALNERLGNWNFWTMFVGFSAEQRPLIAMLESMVGIPDGVRDALTRYTRPLSGAYYFVPSTRSLRLLSGE